MYTHEIVNTINNQNGILSQEQYIAIYDNSPQITAVFVDDDAEYCFEMWCQDKEEPILFNVATGSITMI